MKRENKGFTLVELLIVVAIIAVLAAIAIPIMNNRLESSREAADISNLRSAYALAQSAALTGAWAAETNTDNVCWYDTTNGTFVTKIPTTGGLVGTATDGGTSTLLPNGIRASSVPSGTYVQKDSANRVEAGYNTKTNYKGAQICVFYSENATTGEVDVYVVPVTGK